MASENLPLTKLLGKALRRQRRYADLSQTDFADQSHTSRYAIMAIEDGKGINLESALNLIKAAGGTVYLPLDGELWPVALSENRALPSRGAR